MAIPEGLVPPASIYALDTAQNWKPFIETEAARLVLREYCEKVLTKEVTPEEFVDTTGQMIET